MSRKLFVFVFVLLALSSSIFAREGKNAQEKKKPAKQEKFDPKNPTAEQIAEVVIVAYGGPYGRATLSTIRKTEIERGELLRFAPDGSTVAAKSTYERRIVRGENMEQDRVRIDQKLTEAQYALIYDKSKTFGVINNAVFVPREEADRNFQASIFHSLDALLRYKENGSTVKLAGKEKNMGVEFYQLDVTDKQNRVTRFNISNKLYRVLSLEYAIALTDNGASTKFVRKFYDYRNAQGTSVPWRTVLYANGKAVEEANVSTVTFGMKIEETQFQAES